MFYREAGQFKTSYRADQAIFPIAQDRWFVVLLIAFAFLVVPLFASEYWFSAILIPFLILTLAAIGLNLLVGYCGQISLGTGAFMAVGAYAAYNLALRMPGTEIRSSCSCSAACIATLVGILFGIPSLRIKGFYLAVATLAAQFFLDWMFTRIKWFTNYTPSGSVASARSTCSAFRSIRRQTNICCASRSSPSSRWSRRTSCAAASGACGWRSATWTSPPRSSASARCTRSCRRSR